MQSKWVEGVIWYWFNSPNVHLAGRGALMREKRILGNAPVLEKHTVKCAHSKMISLLLFYLYPSPPAVPAVWLTPLALCYWNIDSFKMQERLLLWARQRLLYRTYGILMYGSPNVWHIGVWACCLLYSKCTLSPEFWNQSTSVSYSQSDIKKALLI